MPLKSSARSQVHATRAGALVLFGLGMGLGVQAPVMAIQTIMKGNDVAVGTAVVVFIQSLLSSIFLSVGDNIFQRLLAVELAALAPVADPTVVISNGVSRLEEAIQAKYPGLVDGILLAYNLALPSVFLVALVLSCTSTFGSLGIEWVSVHKDEPRSRAEKAAYGER
jgi:hypothetical protein